MVSLAAARGSTLLRPTPATRCDAIQKWHTSNIRAFVPQCTASFELVTLILVSFVLQRSRACSFGSLALYDTIRAKQLKDRRD